MPVPSDRATLSQNGYGTVVVVLLLVLVLVLLVAPLLADARVLLSTSVRRKR